MERLEEATRFFESLYGDTDTSTKLATAYISDRGTSSQRFHEPTMRLRVRSFMLSGRLKSMMQKADRGSDMFFAPTPMSGQSGRRKEQALPSHIVYGDADHGLLPHVHARLTALGAMLVLSGGSVLAAANQERPKYHVYLRLTRAVDPMELERLNRILRVYINGDKWDCTTLLRVPGTVNHKYRHKPVVKVERFATRDIDPAELQSLLGVTDDQLTPGLPTPLSPIPDTLTPGTPTDSGVVTPPSRRLPNRPPNFNRHDNGRMAVVVRKLDSRFQADRLPRRYTAVIEIVKEARAQGLDMDHAYAYAERCQPLISKENEENGYSIRKDVARAWYSIERQEAASTTPSSVKAPSDASALEGLSPNPSPNGVHSASPISPAPPAPPAPPTSPVSPNNPLGLGEDFPFFMPNLDELLSGDYKPLEPTMVPCGSFHLLYPGKSHSLVADRGMGKTHIAIAMVHSILRAGGRVAYFDFEDTPDTFILDRMINQHGIPIELIRNQFLYLGNLQEEVGGMDAGEAIKYLAERLAGWDLVVVDGVSASMGSLNDMWDESKAVDYKQWHKVMIQPFLDQKIATLQLDHSTKSGPRAGGTMQKGAKLTGVEYQVRQMANHAFTIGRMGKVILEAAKDRVGRIAKHRRTTPPTDSKSTDEWPWNDVATFTLTSDSEGRITQAEFEPVNYTDKNFDPNNPDSESSTPVLSPREQKIIRVVTQHPGKFTKSTVAMTSKGGVGGNSQDVQAEVERLVSLHYLVKEAISPNRHRLFPAPTPEPEPTTPLDPALQEDENGLDFTNVTNRPRRVECGVCRDRVSTDQLVKPHELGYDPKKRKCRGCADVTTAGDSNDPDWAYRVRRRIEQSRDE